MKRRGVGRVLLIVAVNLVATLLLVELVAVAGYLWQTGKLYYLDPPRGRRASPTIEQSVEGLRIHPFYAFTATPGRDAATNNFGFASPDDYPAPRRHDRELLVGLFGGSVATKLALFEAEHGVFRRALAAELRIDPADVRLLNFSQGGYKQPQQALILTYLRSLGQELDLAINCDGFNEIVLGGRNAEAGLAVDMPSIDHVRALQDAAGFGASPESVERMLEVRAHWARYARVFNRAWGGTAPELVLASGFMADWMLYELHLRRYNAARDAATAAEAASVAGGSWLHLREGPADADQARRLAVEVWARSSRVMHAAQAAAGGAYLHVLQPNQYVETERVFAAEEAAIAFSRQSRYAPFVAAGYEALIAASASLADAGVAFHDLTRIFDPVAATVYADDCCHYNDRGHEILLTFLAEQAAELLSRPAP